MLSTSNALFNHHFRDREEQWSVQPKKTRSNAKPKPRSISKAAPLLPHPDLPQHPYVLKVLPSSVGASPASEQPKPICIKSELLVGHEIEEVPFAQSSSPNEGEPEITTFEVDSSTWNQDAEKRADDKGQLIEEPSEEDREVMVFEEEEVLSDGDNDDKAQLGIDKKAFEERGIVIEDVAEEEEQVQEQERTSDTEKGEEEKEGEFLPEGRPKKCALAKGTAKKKIKKVVKKLPKLPSNTSITTVDPSADGQLFVTPADLNEANMSKMPSIDKLLASVSKRVSFVFFFKV